MVPTYRSREVESRLGLLNVSPFFNNRFRTTALVIRHDVRVSETEPVDATPRDLSVGHVYPATRNFYPRHRVSLRIIINPAPTSRANRDCPCEITNARGIPQYPFYPVIFILITRRGNTQTNLKIASFASACRSPFHSTFENSVVSRESDKFPAPCNRAIRSLGDFLFRGNAIF